MKNYELKVDPKRPHHYFIAVATKPMISKEAGKIFLKYSPFYMHHSQVEKLRDAAMLSKDKLFVTTSSEALKIHGLYELAQLFSMFKLSARVNLCTIHHFSCKDKMKEEDFSIFVESVNNSKTAKRKLLDAKIH